MPGVSLGVDGERAEAPEVSPVLARTVLALCLVVAGIAAALAGTALVPLVEVPGLPTPWALVTFGLPVVRVLLDIAAVATVGLSLLPKLVGIDDPEHTDGVLSAARRFTVWTAAVWLVCALASVVLQATDLSPGTAPTPGLVYDYVLLVGAGKGLLVSAGCALACVLIGRLAVRHGEAVPAELRIFVAVFGILLLPLTGHASNWKWHDVSMVSMELHVMGAAIWTGGLAVIATLLLGHGELLARALPKFSKLATVALFLVGATGLFNGLVELQLTPGGGLPGALFTSVYGQLIVAKTVFLVVLAGLGAHIRFRLLPRIARRERTALFGWASLEVGVMGLAYGIAVVLTRAPVIS
ncbi:CopD family protein [Crossiella cryophila]